MEPLHKGRFLCNSYGGGGAGRVISADDEEDAWRARHNKWLRRVGLALGSPSSARSGSRSERRASSRFPRTRQRLP